MSIDFSYLLYTAKQRIGCTIGQRRLTRPEVCGALLGDHYRHDWDFW